MQEQWFMLLSHHQIEKRNSLGCGLEIGTLSGYIAASILVFALNISLTETQLNSWGWRIPFYWECS